MHKIYARRAFLLLFCVLGVALIPVAWLAMKVQASGEPTQVSEATPGGSAQSSEARLHSDYDQLPLSFEVNRGQIDDAVKFASHGRGYSLFISPAEAVLTLSRNGSKGVAHADSRAGSDVLRMQLVGADANASVGGQEELPGKINYLVGNNPEKWRTDVPTYAKVICRGVYPGVDLLYYGRQRQLEYDFQLSPGADPRAIKLRFEGAQSLHLDADGRLVLRVAGGEVRLQKPTVYQPTGGGRTGIEGRYEIKGGNVVGFRLGAFDARQPLVIDPVLSYATYLGSNGDEFGYGIAVDAQGNAYVVGSTNSFAFPTTGQNFVPTGSVGDAFITKLDPTGSSLVYSTLIGGSTSEQAFGIALDSAGDAYITGRTSSADFPTTANAIRANRSLIKTTNGGASWGASNNGIGSTAVTSFAVDPSNPSTLYASTSGGSGVYKSTDGGANWVALSTGFTSANAVVIDPTTPATIYAAVNAGSFAVFKSTNGGASWAATGAFGGGLLYSLAIDPASPSTLYAGSNSGVFKTTNGGASWTLVNNGLNFGSNFSIVVDPKTPATVYASGGGGGVFKTTNSGASWTQVNTGLSNTTVRALAIDPNTPSIIYAATLGGVFKTMNGAGNWVSTGAGIPANTGFSALALDPLTSSTIYAGSAKGGIFKSVDGGGSWAGVFAGLSASGVNALALNPAAPSNVYAGFDTRAGSSLAFDSEAFVTKLNAAGNALVYSTYLGGDGNDAGNAIAVDSAGSAYVVGETSAANFPAVNARQPLLKGATNAFITKFSPDGGALLFSTYLGGASSDSARAVALDTAGNAYITGPPPRPISPQHPARFARAKSRATPLTLTPSSRN
jgi:hypothetical protein